MPSALKSETARTNGAKSQAPKTPEGKEASSRNSLKHGFTARNTASEKELVDQMAIARWRIRRFVNAETVLIDCEVVRNRGKVEKKFATLGCDVHVAMAIRSLADESRCLSLMSRYEARHQRTHDKAYAALRELQKARASQPIPPEPEPAPAVENKIVRNEPTAPPASSHDIHLVGQVPDLPSPPQSGNPEDQEAES
jgi:hypothetical protein